MSVAGSQLRARIGRAAAGYEAGAGDGGAEAAEKQTTTHPLATTDTWQTWTHAAISKVQRAQIATPLDSLELPDSGIGTWTDLSVNVFDRPMGSGSEIGI